MAAWLRLSRLALVALVALSIPACALFKMPDRPSPKIKLNLERFDALGLEGPPDGKRSADYEFCIPNQDDTRVNVAAIDPTARFHSGLKGRVNCGETEILVIGNTRQPEFKKTLASIAALPYVREIRRVLYEK
jgi:hypothetical protein